MGDGSVEECRWKVWRDAGVEVGEWRDALVGKCRWVQVWRGGSVDGCKCGGVEVWMGRVWRDEVWRVQVWEVEVWRDGSVDGRSVEGAGVGVQVWEVKCGGMQV